MGNECSRLGNEQVSMSTFSGNLVKDVISLILRNEMRFPFGTAALRVRGWGGHEIVVGWRRVDSMYRIPIGAHSCYRLLSYPCISFLRDVFFISFTAFFHPYPFHFIIDNTIELLHESPLSPYPTSCFHLPQPPDKCYRSDSGKV